MSQDLAPPRRSVSVKKLIALGLGGGVAALLAVAGVRSAIAPSRQVAPETRQGRVAPPIPEAEAQALAGRLAQAVRFPTVSYDRAPGAPPPTEENDPRLRQKNEALRGLHAFITASYPALHAALRREVIGGFSLLYTWQGQDAAAPPFLLLAHQDVVPVEPGTEGAWQHPPFSGDVDGGFVWGRGTLDDKNSVVGILEGVERLVRAGYKPRRTIYLAFGHDEEAIGSAGAGAIAATLKQRGVRLAFVLDEGQAIVQGIIPGVKGPVALIGLAEKGYVSLELDASSEGGHSSMPPAVTAVGRLARAITRVESSPFPGQLRGAPRAMFEFVGPEMPQPLRLLFTNLWLFGPIVRWQLGQKASTSAILRTTTAATQLEGSPKDNVLAQHARAVFNFRIIPGDTVDTVTSRVRTLVDDPGVTVRALPETGHDPSPESSPSAPAFQAIARSVRTVFPESRVAPSLMLGASDSRHFVGVADQIYRFVPELVTGEDLARFHGTNERIAVENFAQHVRFYEQLIRTADGD